MTISVLAIGASTAYILGAFATIGFPTRFAEANEVNKIDQRLMAIETQQTIATKITLGQEICRLLFLRQKAEGQLWVQLDQSFNEKQNQYAQIDGNRYPVNECTPPG